MGKRGSEIMEVVKKKEGFSIIMEKRKKKLTGRLKNIGITTSLLGYKMTRKNKCKKKKHSGSPYSNVRRGTIK